MNKEITEILMRFLTFCFQNKLLLSYQNGEGKNYVEIGGSEVVINIYDFNDPNLKDYLNEKLTELSSIIQS